MNRGGYAAAKDLTSIGSERVDNFPIFDNIKTADINTTIIEGYLQLLDNLSPSSKLDLISKLTASVKSDLTNKKASFKKAFGAFQSEKSADEIINEIRSSRIFTRQIEEISKNISLIQTLLFTT